MRVLQNWSELVWLASRRRGRWPTSFFHLKYFHPLFQQLRLKFKGFCLSYRDETVPEYFLSHPGIWLSPYGWQRRLNIRLFISSLSTTSPLRGYAHIVCPRFTSSHIITIIINTEIILQNFLWEREYRLRIVWWCFCECTLAQILFSASPIIRGTGVHWHFAVVHCNGTGTGTGTGTLQWHCTGTGTAMALVLALCSCAPHCRNKAKGLSTVSPCQDPCNA